jgi:DNA-binding NarL/FixJ family response regulator
MPAKATVLVADDQPIMAEALSTSLERWYEVVGIITQLDAVEPAIARLRPDIVLLDVAFGKDNAFAILPDLVKRYPESKVVILTSHAEPVLADAAFRAGAMGFLIKHAAAVELRVAIEEALAGRTYLTPTMQELGAGGNMPLPDSVLIELSPRQRQVLLLLRAGHSHDDIAGQLDIATKTVQFHVESMARRIGVRGKAQLIRWSERFFANGG